MKVWIENCDVPYDKLNGKSLFCRRLADEFRHRGVEVTDRDTKVDVSLNVIRLKHTKAKATVLRMDGVWHDTGKNWKFKNKALSESLKKADAVVYQSIFAQCMCDHYLGKSRKSAIIYNGADPEYYKSFDKIDTEGKNIFFAFSKWRPHKRLFDTIQSFLCADIPDGLLYVAGDISRSGVDKETMKEYESSGKVRYLGPLVQSQIAPILISSIGTLHLCWFDACPNSVVETLCAGIPVICNNTGGTQEIVLPAGGYVCDVDEIYNYQPVDLYHPPEIDIYKIANAIRKCFIERPKINCEYVHIKTAATKYLDFMEQLL